MRHREVLTTALLVAISACSHSKPPVVASTWEWRRICVVLSVGGPDGLAHLGALAALKEAHVPIDCVVGNSMGAVIGALYASAPLDDTTGRFQALMRSYIAATEHDKAEGGILGFLFGAAAVVATGGAALPALAVGGVGFLGGAGSVAKLALRRFTNENHLGPAEYGRAALRPYPCRCDRCAARCND